MPKGKIMFIPTHDLHKSIRKKILFKKLGFNPEESLTVILLRRILKKHSLLLVLQILSIFPEKLDENKIDF